MRKVLLVLLFALFGCEKEMPKTQASFQIRQAWKVGVGLERCNDIVHRFSKYVLFRKDLRSGEVKTQSLPKPNAFTRQGGTEAIRLGDAKSAWSVVAAPHHFEFTPRGARTNVHWDAIPNMSMGQGAVAYLDEEALVVHRLGKAETRRFQMPALQTHERWTGVSWSAYGIAMVVVGNPREKTRTFRIHWFARFIDFPTTGFPVLDGKTQSWGLVEKVEDVYFFVEKEGITRRRLSKKGPGPVAKNIQVSVVQGNLLFRFSSGRTLLRFASGHWLEQVFEKGVLAAPFSDGFVVVDTTKGVFLLKENGERTQVLKLDARHTAAGVPYEKGVERQRFRAKMSFGKVVFEERVRDSFCQILDSVTVFDIKSGEVKVVSGGGDKARFSTRLNESFLEWVEADIRYEQLRFQAETPLSAGKKRRDDPE